MDMKEQIRGEIQANLERLALGCRDLASLLRRLQIPVEGGIFPSPQQVTFFTFWSPHSCEGSVVLGLHLFIHTFLLSIFLFVRLMSSRFEHQTDIWCWPSQVNAAYKKALLRFHPDRSSALAQGDPRRQVEAEETFKLISRMKTTLNPVAISMG